MCVQRRQKSACVFAHSDQSLRCPHEQTLPPWLPKMRSVKILIRLRKCAGLIFARHTCPKVRFLRLRKIADGLGTYGNLSLSINVRGRTHGGPVCGFLVFWLQIAIEPFALIHQSVCDYMCFSVHYENMPIQIYRKFHLQKLKIFR